jgi:hypothetical protein
MQVNPGYTIIIKVGLLIRQLYSYTIVYCVQNYSRPENIFAAVNFHYFRVKSTQSGTQTQNGGNFQIGRQSPKREIDTRFFACIMRAFNVQNLREEMEREMSALKNSIVA